MDGNVAILLNAEPHPFQLGKTLRAKQGTKPIRPVSLIRTHLRYAICNVLAPYMNRP